MGKWSWVKPIEGKDVEKFGCLPPNYRGDVLLRFDPALSNISGNGQAGGAISRGPPRFIKAPCATKEEVWALANSHETTARSKNPDNKTDPRPEPMPSRPEPRPEPRPELRPEPRLEIRPPREE